VEWHPTWNGERNVGNELERGKVEGLLFGLHGKQFERNGQGPLDELESEDVANVDGKVQVEGLGFRLGHEHVVDK
jgi:hypothetical protein